MGFLAPWFFLGSAAVALPVLFHLIRRSPRQRIPFSTLMFLRQSPPRVTRRSRLENILLLLLRCLALCLLAFGFARPFLRQQAQAELGSERSQATIILMDRSASMRQGGLWNRAVAVAETFIDDAEHSDTVSLFAYDHQAEMLLGFDEWNATPVAGRSDLAKTRLADVSPSWYATRTGQALVTSADLLDAFVEEQKSSQIKRRIILVSDFQEGSYLASLQQYDWPRGIELQIEIVEAAESNAGIHAIPDPQQPGQTRLQIHNSRDSQIEDLTVFWGEAETDTRTLHVPAGRSVTATLRTRDADSIALQGDKEPFDNESFLVPFVAPAHSLLYFGDDDASEPKTSLYFLRRALFDTAQRRIDIRVCSEDDLLEQIAPEIHLLVVTDRIDKAAGGMRKQLELGNAVFVSLGSLETAKQLGDFLELEQWQPREAAISDYSMFGEIDFEHPLFSPFASPLFSNFTKIHIWKYRVIAEPVLLDPRILARTDQGDPLLWEMDVFGGKMLALTTGWHSTDSELAVSSKFAPLLDRIIHYTANKPEVPSQILVGDPIVVPRDIKAGQSVEVIDPRGQVTTLALAESREFRATDSPGRYTLQSGEFSTKIAVNLDPQESQTSPLAPEILDQYAIAWNQSETTIERAAEDEKKRQLLATELEGQQKMWRWIVFASIMVLGMETWLAGRLVLPAGGTNP